MAADCKSAALWSYGGSNPPLCTSFMKLLMALGGYAVIAIMEWFTLSSQKVQLFDGALQGSPRSFGLAVLGALAVFTIVHHQRMRLDRERGRE